MDMQEFSQKIQAKNFLDDLRVQKDEGNTNCGEKLLMHENEARGDISLRSILAASYMFSLVGRHVNICQSVNLIRTSSECVQGQISSSTR